MRRLNELQTSAIALVVALALTCACRSSGTNVAPTSDALFRGQDSPSWAQKLRAELPNGNSDAIQALVALAPEDPQAEQIVLQLLRDRDVGVRDKTTRQLDDFSPALTPAIAEALITSLQDIDYDTVEQSLSALVRYDLASEVGFSPFRTELSEIRWNPSVDLARYLNDEAWNLVAPEDPVHQGFELGLLMARPAVRLAPSAKHLHTLAWALYQNGLVEEAAATERQALDGLPREADSETRDKYQAALAQFEGTD